MANPQAFYEDDDQNDKEQDKDSSSKKNPSFDINKDKNKKETTNGRWKNFLDNSPLAIVLALTPFLISGTGLWIANQQYKEKSLAEYVEFVKDIFFDVYYSNSKDPRIPAVSVSNFISSKTVTTLKTLENSKQQKELLDFLKQAKIGFLPISKDPKFEDIPDEIIKTIENEYDCPLDYKPDKQSDKQAVTPDEDGKAKTPHPRITNPCLLTGINLKSINFNGQDLKYVVLKKANLIGTKFNGAELQYANFMGADLSQVEMKKAYLSRANFENATPRGAKFNGADLRGANFNSANLEPIGNSEGIILTNFTGANLSQVEMKKADLSQANFEKATLRGAKFNGADLRGANFKAANLKPIENSEGIILTDFTGAKLDGADFTLANLRGAIFSNLEESKTKITLCQTILPNGHIANPNCKP